jgi:hypothetical protein
MPTFRDCFIDLYIDCQKVFEKFYVILYLYIHYDKCFVVIVLGLRFLQVLLFILCSVK